MDNNNYSQYVTVEDFVEESRTLISEYKCPLCFGIYFNPVIDSCGHIFCENCFNISYAKNNSCPIEGGPIQSMPMKIMLLSGILEKQRLYCRNKKDGCAWSGLYKDLFNHLNMDCPKEKVACLLEQCPSFVFREDYQNHIQKCEYRTVECPDCHIKCSFKQIKDHELQCLKRKSKCHQGCDKSIDKEHLDNHINNECIYTVIPCPFARFGCPDRFARKDKDMMVKEGMSKHLILLLKSFEELEKRSNAIEKKVADMNQQSNLVYLTKTSNEEMMFIAKKRNPSESHEVISLIENLNNNNKNNNHKTSSTSNSNKKERVILIPEETDVFSLDESPKISVDSLFDKINIGLNIKIYGNKARYNTNIPMEHKYLLGTKAIEINDKNCITSWVFTLLTQSHWVAFGICDKDQVLSNNLKFISNRKGFDHGSFLFSSNGYTWNCNNSEENNKSIDMPEIQQGDKLSFQYNPQTQELCFYLRNYSGTLSRVFPKKGNILTICVLFLHPQDEIQIENYRNMYHITQFP